jgi:hypothetical protein
MTSKQKLEIEIYKSICEESNQGQRSKDSPQPWQGFCEGSRRKNTSALVSPEPAWNVTFSPTPSSRCWAQHLPAPSEAGQQSYSSQRQSRTSLPGGPLPKKFFEGSLATLASTYGHARSSPQRPVMARAQDRVLSTKPSLFSGQKQASFKQSSTQQRKNE